MPLLHLGVLDQPYIEPTPAGGKKRRRGGGPDKSQASKYTGVTTGMVAGWLEDRYHVMEHFAELHGPEIVTAVEDSLKGSIESFLMGAPVTLDVFGSATSKIEDAFKQMLSQRELDRLGYPGIPTLAAMRGVSHRFKRPYVRRPERPSFVDTGLYVASFKAWVT